MHSKTMLGREGEAIIGAHLKKQGFTILAYNYRQQYGEIDLIAADTQYILFVEVKTRQTCYFDPTEVIQQSKQKKIGLVAGYYVSCHPEHAEKIQRFDVALLEGDMLQPKITYISDAFTPPMLF